MNARFNHIIGLPSKNGESKPMFDYEKMLYNAMMEPTYLNTFHSPSRRTDNENIRAFADRKKIESAIPAYPFKNKHVWIKKATGLGVTEFMLRFMTWLCLRNDDYSGSQMVIVTGPNQEMAIKLIKRLKGIFETHGITFDSKETVIELNGCTIEAYPSNHIDAFRSLSNPKFIYIDEADFFRKNEQDEVRHVAERYIAKSDPFIVMVSTPYTPDGLFAQIEKEPFESCIYKKIFLDYTYGLDKIYTKAEIDKASASPSFKREYCLEYQGGIGNIFSTNAIERCQKIGYDPKNIVQDAIKSMGIDPGYANFAIVVTQFVNERIEVIFAEEYEREHANFNIMIDRVWEIKQRCGHLSNIYVDAANPVVWDALKREFNEPYNDQYVKDKIAYCKKNNIDVENRMFIVPVPFNPEGAEMLQHTKSLLEDPENLLAIHPSFDKLLTSLRTAVSLNFSYKLDKENTTYDDVLDAFRLSLNLYRWRK